MSTSCHHVMGDMNNQKTWVATFNGATAHVFSATEEGRLTTVLLTRPAADAQG